MVNSLSRSLGRMWESRDSNQPVRSGGCILEGKEECCVLGSSGVRDF